MSQRIRKIRKDFSARCVGLSVLMVILMSAPTFSDDQDGFVSLFNGQDLSGWEGLKRVWFAEDGVLTGRHDGSVHTFLCSQDSYSDFVLKVSARLGGPQANSGIQFRSKKVADYHVQGYQAEVAGASFGALVDEPARGLVPFADKEKKVIREGDWNDFVITCRGDHIKIEVNGTTTVNVIDPAGNKEGIVAFQLHVGQPMEVQFKDIWIKELALDPNEKTQPDSNADKDTQNRNLASPPQLLKRQGKTPPPEIREKLVLLLEAANAVGKPLPEVLKEAGLTMQEVMQPSDFETAGRKMDEVLNALASK